MEIDSFECAPTGEYHLASFNLFIEEDNFFFNNLKLCRSKKGHLYIKFPQYKTSSGEWKNVAGWGSEKMGVISKEIKDLLESKGLLEKFST